MVITLQNTSKMVEVNGVPARVWEGQTATGIPVTCLITRIAVAGDADVTQFEGELRETKAPSTEIEAWPLRMVL